ncbi:hypothetical protein GCM10017788_67720 [Amycolatopsis acidiphila]|nr:hypothetical protein GCM10017788_67720 [Amycolatopsis acidiphila]
MLVAGRPILIADSAALARVAWGRASPAGIQTNRHDNDPYGISLHIGRDTPDRVDRAEAS